MKNSPVRVIIHIVLFCAVALFSAAAVRFLRGKGGAAPAYAYIVLTTPPAASAGTFAETTLPRAFYPVITVESFIEATLPRTTAPAAETAETTAETTTEKTSAPPTAVKTTMPATVPATEPPGIRFTNPELADSGQILLVTVANATTSYADIVYYEKNGKVWTEVFSSPGRVGANGVAPEADRLQDTYKTPSGIHKIIGAFGKADDPGAVFPYIKVTSEMYWDLNSGSPNYNRLVYSDPGGEREHLIEYNSYLYALNTDYNYEQTPGKGGAIFIHCNGAGATAGCVSMPADKMKTLIMSVDPAKNPAAVITLKSNLSSYTN